MTNGLTTSGVDKSVKGFADGYTSLEFTTYKLKLTVTSSSGKGRGYPDYAWTYFQILVKRIELELGPEEAIPVAVVDDPEHKRNKAVRSQIETDGGLPAAGGTARKVILLSNQFKTTLSQMNDNSAFTAYRGRWGDGPSIPIVAKIRL